MSTEQTIDLTPYNPEYTSVIHDIEEDRLMAVALREDIGAFAKDSGITIRNAAYHAAHSLFEAMPSKRTRGYKTHVDHFAIGPIIETRRPVVLHPTRMFGLRLDHLDVVIELIDKHEHVEKDPRLEEFSTVSANLIRRFKDAVLL